jgi:hypothetical protein
MPGVRVSQQCAGRPGGHRAACACTWTTQVIATAQETHTPPAATAPVPEHMYVSMDGVVAHTREAG